jgi:predicted site-specific integrase-resolvase
MNEQQVTAAVLMALYGVTRPTAINWFNDGLIEGVKGEGVTDSWIATPAALHKFHNDHIITVNVYQGEECLNLPGPWAAMVSDLAERSGVTRGMAYLYVKKGYVPGAIKLPNLTGGWRLPVGYEPLAAKLRNERPDLRVNIGSPLPGSLPPIDRLLGSC